MVDRNKRVPEIAHDIYMAISDALEQADVDVGEGIAVCQLVASWLEGSAEAQLTMSKTDLMGVPYFLKGSESDD